MEELTDGLDIIMMCRFGSHLYGTDTPESDTDYKGIFMPTRDQILLGRVPKSVRRDSKTSREQGEKNGIDDVDCEFYSLHYFLELCLKGETAALDMLHCNEDNLLYSTQIWDSLISERKRFYTKSLKAFVGYARKQAAKYGLKGSRLAATKQVKEFLGRHPGSDKMVTVWENLPINEHCMFLPVKLGEIMVYQVCGKQFQATAQLQYVYDILTTFIGKYGDRAKKAEANDGVDWKAMSHAIRAAFQVKQILTIGTITFPLPIAECLKDIKLGHHDFNGYVLPLLEEMMDEVEALSAESTLPSKPTHSFWDMWLVNTLQREVFT